ncbi:hypothetical protein KCV87_05595 [Actinosynnema pretiosum subsp. pretiosum]|uniref:Glycosyl hydrolase family 98 putative carbohydrate-binding module domain-containing protein n=1 Tax=Actinosynnema pretiosum subsp. pretiosum TaxID=103721 RepID=A0AA45L9J7_9PSEU|nr:hypothetical protein APASM_2905 [Actinosynnema pretiosum subsp. pretiosum]QUF05573.1 hypothetical protein KCV87_05595 [Actinosynnema pretiosum subsp. pretiosum]
MTENELAASTVHALSQYLAHKQQVGSGVFDARLEGLLGEVEAALSDGYGAETLARFQADPTSGTTTSMLVLQLAEAMQKTPGLDRDLRTVLGGHVAPKPKRWKRPLLVGVGLAAVAAVAASVLLVDRDSPQRTNTTALESSPVGMTTTTTTTTASPTTTTSAASRSSSAASTSIGTSAVAGNGSSLQKGQPVFLSELPTPGDMTFQLGDSNVQMDPYNNSLWADLYSCPERERLSQSQEFKLKNFSKLVVKAVGLESTSAPELSVRFEVFANTNGAEPIGAVDVPPGESRPLEVALPENVFSLELRMTMITRTERCKSGTAVWGSAYVVAKG